jgi:hypothetical protein
MRFLVYTVEPLEDNASFDSFEQGADKEITRIISILRDMNFERVMENQTVSLLVDDVEYNQSSGIVAADIYKQTNPGKALHQLAQEGDERTLQEIISEHEDAFVHGLCGMKKAKDEVRLIVEKNFGSFFVAACKGMDITPHYSSDSV